MPIDESSPLYPGHAMGLLYGRGLSTVVLWPGGHTFEASPLASATPEVLEAFEHMLDELRRGPPLRNMADSHDAIVSAGWDDRGVLIYDVQSGILLANAAALAEMAEELWHEREEILADAGGRHPDTGTETWVRWVALTARRSATVRGARALALAAVEALLNELLAAQHPEKYETWEIRKRMGFGPKIKKLLELHEMVPDDVPWFEAVETHSQLRNSMIHHRPDWVVDDSEEHSVAPKQDMTQESLAETLEVVHDAIGGLFALYGATTPVTHRPDWLKRTAGW